MEFAKRHRRIKIGLHNLFDSIDFGEGDDKAQKLGEMLAEVLNLTIAKRRAGRVGEVLYETERGEKTARGLARVLVVSLINFEEGRADEYVRS